MTRDVRIFEVSPREGLRNEKAVIPTPDKTGLIDILSSADFERAVATGAGRRRRTWLSRWV